MGYRGSGEVSSKWARGSEEVSSKWATEAVGR